MILSFSLNKTCCIMHFICIFFSSLFQWVLIFAFKRCRTPNFISLWYIFVCWMCCADCLFSLLIFFFQFFVKPQIQSKYQQYTISASQKKKTIKKGTHLITMSLYFEIKKKEATEAKSKQKQQWRSVTNRKKNGENIKMYGI